MLRVTASCLRCFTLPSRRASMLGKRTASDGGSQYAKRQTKLTKLFSKPAGPTDCSAEVASSTGKVEWIELGQGSKIGYWPRAIDKKTHDSVFQELLAHAPWTTGHVKLYGKAILQPRSYCYMADDTSKGYEYTGNQLHVEPWLPCVLPLKQLAEAACGVRFNSCLLNLYRDGGQHVSWHADDERVYAKNSTICSVSLGQARDFQMREKANHANRRSYALGNGDLFVMAGTLQTFWQHQVPKRANVPQPRVSLTFRTVTRPS